MEQELSQRSNLLEKKIEEKNKLLVKQQVVSFNTNALNLT